MYVQYTLGSRLPDLNTDRQLFLPWIESVSLIDILHKNIFGIHDIKSDKIWLHLISNDINFIGFWRWSYGGGYFVYSSYA